MLKNLVISVYTEMHPVNVNKSKPVCVAARRKILAIIALNENGPGQANWIDEEDLDAR